MTTASDESVPPRIWRTQAVPIALAGLICGLDAIGFAIAVASLIFVGPLSSGLGMGVTAALASTILTTLIVGWRSVMPTSIASVQDIGAAILAVALAASAAHGLPGGISNVATAFAVIAAATATSAIFLIVAGQFGLWRVVRFFPHEVLAGFMAATGVLLLTGALAMVTGAPADINAWLSLADAGNLLRATPALVLGLVIYMSISITRRPIVLLALLLMAAAAFHAWRSVFGASLDYASENHLLLHTAGATTLALPFPSGLGEVDWTAVAMKLPTILVVGALSLFGALMNVSALELAKGADLDIGHELKQAGFANIAAAACGGPPAYTDLASSRFVNRLGIKVRGAAFAVVLVEIAGLFWAGKILGFIPIFVAAGLIVYYGIDLVKEWLVDARRKFSRREWLVVLLIVTISTVYSFVVAILVGFFIATLLFAISYANSPIIRIEAGLDRLRSTRDRRTDEVAYLAQSGHQVAVFQLQGYLFFGTSERIVVQIRNLVQRNPRSITKVILDFSKVANLDSASANALVRLSYLAGKLDFHVIFCGLTATLRDTLLRGGLDLNTGISTSESESLDQALEHAEDELLARRPAGAGGTPLLEHLSLAGGAFASLFAVMTREEYERGQVIIRDGDAADRILFVESGRVVVRRAAADGKPRRLRTMQAGAIVGEIAFLMDGTRTADVVAEEATVVRVLTANRVAELEREQPDLAIAIHRLLGRALAEKVIAANRMIEQVGQ